LFYASAVFLAGFLAGQWLERKTFEKKNKPHAG